MERSIDIEKVIKALEICVGENDFSVCVEEQCPYIGGSKNGCCITNLERDALALLKEQQKLIDDTPHWIFGNSYGHAWMKCSNCCVSQSGQTACWSYCPNCGARMEGQVERDD